MILVTEAHITTAAQLLSGVLLDPITEADYRKGVFNAFLVSDQIREVVCELPKYLGGHGTTRDGLYIFEFRSELLGIYEYTDKPMSNNMLVRRIAENRINLITISDIAGVSYPAFLAFEKVSPPEKTEVIVLLELGRQENLPDVRAFATKNPKILEDGESKKPVQIGRILPIRCIAANAWFSGALELVKELGENNYTAFIYHEAGKVKPFPGDTLERYVSRQNPANRDQNLEFRAKIGTIVLCTAGKITY